MSQREGLEDQRVSSLSSDDCLDELFFWIRNLDRLTETLDPSCRWADLIENLESPCDPDHLAYPLTVQFGPNTKGEALFVWCRGLDPVLPYISAALSPSERPKLSPEQIARTRELLNITKASFQAFLQEWELSQSGLKHRSSTEKRRFAKPLTEASWTDIQKLDPSLDISTGGSLSTKVDDAIRRVRSFFAPLDSPFLGMDEELLFHHVHETIPREGGSEPLTPVVPLFGEGHLQEAFPSVAHLPAHLRVILHRLVRSQKNEDILSALVSTLEAVDFSLRFATGLGQGALARLTDNSFRGEFSPEYSANHC